MAEAPGGAGVHEGLGVLDLWCRAACDPGHTLAGDYHEPRLGSFWAVALGTSIDACLWHQRFQVSLGQMVLNEAQDLSQNPVIPWGTREALGDEPATWFSSRELSTE